MCNVIVNLLQVRVSLAALLTEFFHHDAGLSDSLCINAYFHNVFLCVCLYAQSLRNLRLHFC